MGYEFEPLALTIDEIRAKYKLSKQTLPISVMIREQQKQAAEFKKAFRLFQNRPPKPPTGTILQTEQVVGQNGLKVLLKNMGKFCLNLIRCI